jgi:hypothetical protein
VKAQVQNEPQTILKAIQAALNIRGFVICGFDYPRLVIYAQNLLSADIYLSNPQILPFLLSTKDIKMPKQWSLAVLVFAGYFENARE